MRDQLVGALIGLAVGDAVGAPREFKKPGTFKPLKGMIGGAQYGYTKLKAGEWTDDTSMALCLAKSLIESKGFDAHDQMEKYLKWMDYGYMSSTGECFDIGTATIKALMKFDESGNPYAGDVKGKSAGNGSLMRLAPVVMYYHKDPEKAMNMAASSSRTTHPVPVAVIACRYFAGLLLGAFKGDSKEELLAPMYAPLPNYWGDRKIPLDLKAVMLGNYKLKEPPLIRARGYVVGALEAALWAFHNTNNFKDGCLMAANLGDDADTVAAIYGQLAGAYYGLEAIPATWRRKLAYREMIIEIAEGLIS